MIYTLTRSAVVFALGIMRASTTAPGDAREIVFASQIDQDRRLEVVLNEVRPTTKPAAGSSQVKAPATAPATSPLRIRVPEFTEVYMVRMIERGHPDGTVLWEYERGRFSEWSSDRMRYRVLSAAVIGDYLFVADKMALSTGVVMVRPRDTKQPGVALAAKHVATDSDADGAIVVSAMFRGGSLADSWLVLNHDQEPRFRREIRLSDHFYEEKDKSKTAPASTQGGKGDSPPSVR